MENGDDFWRPVATIQTTTNNYNGEEAWQHNDGASVAWRWSFSTNRRIAMTMEEKLNSDDDRTLAAAMDLGGYKGLLNFHFFNLNEIFLKYKNFNGGKICIRENGGLIPTLSLGINHLFSKPILTWVLHIQFWFILLFYEVNIINNFDFGF